MTLEADIEAMHTASDARHRALVEATLADSDARRRALKTEADADFKRAMRREIFWSVAWILWGVAVLTATILNLSGLLHPANQQPMFPPGTVITIPPAKS